jgi:hypothetical protein
MYIFTDFPRTLIVVGHAERLEGEVAALERALEHERVRAWMVWAKDAVYGHVAGGSMRLRLSNSTANRQC